MGINKYTILNELNAHERRMNYSFVIYYAISCKFAIPNFMTPCTEASDTVLFQFYNTLSKFKMTTEILQNYSAVKMPVKSLLIYC